MFIRILISILAVISVSCSKPHENPELLDPIYLDIQKQLANKTAEFESAKKMRADLQTDFNKVKPQTGQIKYATKRLNEIDAVLDKHKQMIMYWELRVASRKQEARDKYRKAFASNTHWPDPDEFKRYQIQQKLENTPRNWNTKQRITDSQIGIPKISEEKKTTK